MTPALTLGIARGNHVRVGIVSEAHADVPPATNDRSKAVDPALIRSVVGLAGQALKGGAGQLAKAKARNQATQVEQIQGRIHRATQSSIVPLLNRLESELSPAEKSRVFRLFVRSEYYDVARLVSVSVATQELKRSRADINEIAAALLIVHAQLSKSKADRVAQLIVNVLISLNVEALEDLKRTSPVSYGQIVDRAAAEKNAGYLGGVTQRTSAIAGRSVADLPGIAQYSSKYLAGLRSKVENIIPASLDDQKSVPIDSIYVDPRFTSYDKSRRGPDDREEAETTIGLNGLIDASYRTVILGDPGAGKSTSLQKIAYQLSKARGSEDDDHATIPFIITLRRYEALKRQRSLSLVQYLEETIREDFHLPAPDGVIEFLLSSGKCIVLFDGLDELLDTYKRKDIADGIETFAKIYGATKIFATSRRIGYWEAPLNPGTFTVVGLSELNNEEVEEYARKWFSLQPNLDASERSSVAESFVRESETIQDLRSNPLMLSLLCNVYRGERSIPQNRADLYERCATMLFERWDEQRGIHKSDVLKADARAALQEIAYSVFLSGGALDPLPEKKLKTKLTQFWLGEHFESRADAENAAKSLYRSWHGRAWVLTDAGTTSSGERLYRFTHRTFLEYFTAIEVVRRNPSPPRLWRILGPRIAGGSWDIVSQIAIQVLDERYRGARRKIYEAITKDLDSATIDSNARLNLLSFAARHIDALNPPPANCRELVRSALSIAVEGQPTYTDIPSYRDYLRVSGDWIAPGDKGRARNSDPDETFGPERSMDPLIELICAPGNLGKVAIDELGKAIVHDITALDDVVAARTFTFGASISKIGVIAEAIEKSANVQADLELMEANVVRAVERAGIAEQRLQAWSNETFWAPVVAVRCGLATARLAITCGMVEAIMCAETPIFHRAFESDQREMIGVRLLRSYLMMDECSSNEYRETVLTLAAFAEVVDELGPDLAFDGDWMGLSHLERKIVAPYFAAQSHTHAVQVEEEFLRKKDMPTNLDAAYGAAVLLAIVTEYERWNITDESDDHVALLRLRSLQPLEWVFVSRLIPNFEADAVDALTASGLGVDRVDLLRSWACRDFSFLGAANFTSRR